MVFVELALFLRPFFIAFCIAREAFLFTFRIFSSSRLNFPLVVPLFILLLFIFPLLLLFGVARSRVGIVTFVLTLDFLAEPLIESLSSTSVTLELMIALLGLLGPLAIY